MLSQHWWGVLFPAHETSFLFCRVITTFLPRSISKGNLSLQVDKLFFHFFFFWFSISAWQRRHLTHFGTEDAALHVKGKSYHEAGSNFARCGSEFRFCASVTFSLLFFFLFHYKSPS